MTMCLQNLKNRSNRHNPNALTAAGHSAPPSARRRQLPAAVDPAIPKVLGHRLLANLKN